MKGNNNALVREFSDLGPLQASKTLTYSCALQCEALREYCLRISEFNNDVLLNEVSRCIYADATCAENILRFLYENGVTPSVLNDVLMDLRGQGLLAMEG